MNIDEIELRRLDLTVLLVFLNLQRFGKASLVAEHMGLTQSSISHSLKRLREAFGDPLFLRNPKGMEPTAVALALEPKIRRVVETLSDALNAQSVFDPAQATDVIRIGAYDNEMTTLIPDLLQSIQQQAPGMRVSLRSLGRHPALEALLQHDIDLALGFAWNIPRSIHKIDLYEETYALVMRAGHPLAGQEISLDTYVQAQHLVVSPSGDLSGIVDMELAKIGKTRHISLSVPQFLPALSILATTDLITLLPSRLAASQAARYSLTTAKPPLEVRNFPVSALLHERHANSPMHAWLIEALRQNTLSEHP